MKNDVFSLKRFSRYFVTDLRAAISNYGISLLVLASMILTIDLFSGAFSSLISGSWSGIGLGGRSTLMFIFFLIAIISAPSKIYGHITGRKEGTAFLMLPASTLEKFISMVLICAAVVPLAYFVLTAAVDILTCLIDPTCGVSVVSEFSIFRDKLLTALQSDQEVPLSLTAAIDGLSNPLLYADDIASLALAFLLGAILFRKSKTAKTIGCMILISMAVSMIFTPIIMLSTFGQMIKDPTVIMSENLADTLPFLGWIFKHPVLVDTVSDTIWNVALLFLIWLRLKKMKH